MPRVDETSSRICLDRGGSNRRSHSSKRLACGGAGGPVFCFSDPLGWVSSLKLIGFNFLGIPFNFPTIFLGPVLGISDF
ncbi:hypothetical protein V6N12_060654 [Hibiscus sabdariffa]|uniref:Uncharacterized protein n=1 Tax=Hibiscus sabdariffa TaxID=183260 RepID=A0ABR2D536_9ROSI